MVDDERSQRKNVRQTLHSEGYTVLESADCNHAIATFENHRDEISLLLTDVSLSDGTGCDLAITLKKRKPGLRALFMSGSVGSVFCRYFGLDVTGMYFLPKPFRPADLVERVRQVLSSPAVKLYRVVVPKTLSASGTSYY
jgi:DNA-binding response OmpR family regulator